MCGWWWVFAAVDSVNHALDCAEADGWMDDPEHGGWCGWLIKVDQGGILLEQTRGGWRAGVIDVACTLY